MTMTKMRIPKKGMITLAVTALLVAGILGGYGVLPKAFAATAPTLGTAAPFAVLAYSGITNTGTTTITGNVGSYPTPAETGFSTVTITGTNYPAGAPSTTQTDLASAISQAMGDTPTQIPTALDTQTLVPGTYDSASTAFTLSGGVLTLNGQGNSGSVWIFQAPDAIAGALSTTGGSVVLEDGADSCNVFWVTSAGGATIGTGTAFIGTILAYSSVTLGTGATLDGAALANTGDVTMAGNTISTACIIAPITSTTTSTTSTTTATSTTTSTTTATSTTTSTSSTTSTTATTTASTTTSSTSVGTTNTSTCPTNSYSGYYTNSTTHATVNFTDLPYATAIVLIEDNPPGAMGCASTTTTTSTTSTTTTSNTCASPASPVTLTVDAETANGTPLTGYYVLFNCVGITTTATGFTPATFGVISGTTHTIAVLDYGCYTFSHWADTGNSSMFRSFSITAPTTFTAVYNNSCAPTPAGSSTISVNAVTSSGSAVTGIYTTLWANGALVQSCFGPCTMTVANGQTYQVVVASFGSNVFSSWTDGVTTPTHSVVIGGASTAVSLTAVYT